MLHPLSRKNENFASRFSTPEISNCRPETDYTKYIFEILGVTEEECHQFYLRTLTFTLSNSVSHCEQLESKEENLEE